MLERRYHGMPAPDAFVVPPARRPDRRRRGWLARARRAVYAIVRLPATPHQIALGVALGAFVSLTPTMGVQMVVAAALAAVLGGSVRAALPVVWISNPLTAVPLFFITYETGRLFWPWAPRLSVAELSAAFADASGSWAGLSSLGGQLVVPLGIGGALLGAVLAAVTYPATRWLAEQHQARRAQRRIERQARRASQLVVGLPTRRAA